MITGSQIVAHLVGDYILQSSWMANNKTKETVPALVHAFVYSLVFYFAFWPSIAAWWVIFGAHFLIDRFRLARFVCYAKDWFGMETPKPWKECSATGYSPETPPFLAVWLLIIADNTIHLIINGLALKYL